MMDAIWTFGYKKNPQPATTAQVAAKDEPEALRIAMAWCEQNGSRFFGSVRPFVVADRSILGEPVLEPVAPKPIEPTPQGFIDRALDRLVSR